MGYKDKEVEREHRRQYYLKHRQVILDRAIAWNKAHPEQVRDNLKVFYERHKT